MNVLLLSKYTRTGASSRLRTLQYLPELAAKDIQVDVCALFDEEYLQALQDEGRRSPSHVAGCYARRLRALTAARKYDLVWLEKEIFPYFPATTEAVMAKLGAPYVVDYDDAVFHHYDLAANPLLRRLLGRKIDRVMHHARVVVAGNEYLAARARAAQARRVVVIPTVVDHTRYLPHRHDGATQPIIGWIGSRSTQRYLVEIGDALREACGTHGAKLVAVGATEELAGELSGVDVEVVRWTEDSEAQLVSRFDVGIMPLVDGPWERGKCGYKLIQYMACSVPFVASAVGANVDIVRRSDAGLLADDTASWTKALTALLHSDRERQTLGARGRQAVESFYSLQAQAPVMAELLRSCLE